jgi:hypothetical protein
MARPYASRNRAGPTLGFGQSRSANPAPGLSSAPDATTVRERLRRLQGYRWHSYRAYIGLDGVVFGPAGVRPEAGGTGGGGRIAERRGGGDQRPTLGTAVDSGPRGTGSDETSEPIDEL